MKTLPSYLFRRISLDVSDWRKSHFPATFPFSKSTLINRPLLPLVLIFFSSSSSSQFNLNQPEKQTWKSRSPDSFVQGEPAPSVPQIHTLTCTLALSHSLVHFANVKGRAAGCVCVWEDPAAGTSRLLIIHALPDGTDGRNDESERDQSVRFCSSDSQFWPNDAEQVNRCFCALNCKYTPVKEKKK